MVVATWSDFALALGELGVGCRDILNHFVVGRLIERGEVVLDDIRAAVEGSDHNMNGLCLLFRHPSLRLVGDAYDYRVRRWRRDMEFLHLLGVMFEHILLKKEIADGSNGVEVDLRAEVVENIRSRRRLLVDVTEFGDRGPVDARADEDLKNVLGIDIDIRPEIDGDGCVRFVR